MRYLYHPTDPAYSELTRHIWVDDNPSRKTIEACYAQLTRESYRMQVLRGRLAYGDGTPDSVEGCMAKIDSGECSPFVVWYFGSELGGFHTLHDRSPENRMAWVGGYCMAALRRPINRPIRMAWVGGYCMAALRRPINRPIRMAAHPLKIRAFNAHGYDTIHCAILSWNTPAITWATEEHGYTWVGHYDDFILAGGDPAPCEVFTLRPQDVDLAAEVAEARRLTPTVS